MKPSSSVDWSAEQKLQCDNFYTTLFPQPSGRCFLSESDGSIDTGIAYGNARPGSIVAGRAEQIARQTAALQQQSQPKVPAFRRA